VATIALVVFRLCGYRLMQTGNTKTRDVTPEAPTTPWRGGRQETQDAHEQAVAPPDGAIRCGWIVALLAFGFVALLGPAYAVLSDRSRVAQDRESEQEWKAVGIIAQVQDGRVTSMAFSPGKPISQAALEKFRAEADKIGVRSLALSGQPITDEELRHLSALKELRHLRLDRTRITDAGLVHLVRLEGLESLDLAHTQVTDEGLKTLARMPSLTTLGFDGTRIGDAGLTHLAPLRRLEVIYLAKTSATQQGIATFESASPERRVIQQGLENLIRQLGATGACLADWD
jgi:hypothetical protein